jgi:penicillin-insensitive murein endopeptidase
MPAPRARAASLAALLLCAAAAAFAIRPAAAQDEGEGGGGDPQQAALWAAKTLPSPGAPEVIGSYTNGCIAGAASLPAEGIGFQTIRLSRNRYWGHPNLVAFIERLGHATDAAGLPPFLVADMGQPRGGPITGHASHEIGLDADIWLRLDLPLLPAAQREGLSAEPLVGPWEDVLWAGGLASQQATLIRLAAADPAVERIFVHPAIKAALCAQSWPDRTWLHKVRPWTNHTEHMHVRLGCPAGSPLCVVQSPPPPGDGCGEDLAQWFPMTPPVRDPNAPPPPPPPPLPEACAAVLAAP